MRLRALGSVIRKQTMAGSLGGNLFSGGSSIGLGGFLDDLFGETEDVAGDTTSATTGTPKTTDATVIGGTAGPKAKQSPGALPKFGTCPSDMIDDPLNPQNFCIPNPKKNFTCPSGQIYDYVKQGCVPYQPDLITGAVPQTGVICPYGTKAVGKACVSLVGTSVVAPIAVKPPSPAGPMVPDGINALTGSDIPTWAIVLAGVGVVGIVGTAVYAKKNNGRMPWQKKGGRR